MENREKNVVCACGKEKAWDDALCPYCEDKGKSVQVASPSVVATPSGMIQMALQSGADLEKLEKLLTLQEKWDANEAKKAYHVAMAAFKSIPLEIDKDKKVEYSTSKGQVGYFHASLANVVKKITSELGKHGLSASWNTQQNGKVTVTCKITHVSGHSEETTLTAEADLSGSKNSIQAIGSTITYLQRYTILSALGLATGGQDDDGHSATLELIDDSQLGILRDSLAEINENEGPVCKYLGIETLEQLPKASYQKAVNVIAQRKKVKQ